MKYSLSLNSLFKKNRQSGFSLVEMAVVASIIGILSTALITSFSRTRIDMEQSSSLVVATIRDAQTRAIASRVYAGYNPCGYGIHYVSPTQIAIYVGPNAGTTNCAGINKNYDEAEDTLLNYITLADTRVEIKSAFEDIFFLPPDPKTYLNNDASLNQAPLTIQVGVPGEACSSDCRTISVYSSGKIEVQ
ncbi:MAG: type II secretion system protein [Patescibacteria group bacterium]